MNRAERRAAEKVCRREGHLTKNTTDEHGKVKPLGYCCRCEAEQP